ncbi:hypothetical protein PYCC9005_001220 [Savitreella phatthalungensis]
MKIASLATVLSLLAAVSAHSAIVAAVGDGGPQIGKGMGIRPGTPRDGTRRQPFQTDTAIIRDREVTSGRASACGRTLAGGKVDMEQELAQAMTQGIARVRPGGLLTMTVHQVNADGAGGFQCQSLAGDGTVGETLEVVQQVPGVRGRSRARATDFPLTVRTSANQPRTGPNNNVIIVRCRNPVGPFGACAPAMVVG